MPSEYTNIIGKKDGVTFQEFAMRCARGMGACIMMRDESLDAPIPERFKPSAYHTDRLKEAENEVARLELMRDDEIKTECETEFARAVAAVNETNERSAALQAKYNKMLADVMAWDPPTKDHDGLKRFMVDQIEESARFDCHTMPLPVKNTPKRWHQ